MIYTVTFNPALDYAMITDKLTLGETNRSREEYILTGGKGINVSAMLCNLGIENTALGFIGGFTGMEIKKRAEKIGCICDFIEVGGLSRINVKIKSEQETEINGSGPVINSEHISKLIEKISRLKSGDYLVLAGSIPNGISDNVYGEIMKNTDSGVKIIVDAAGSLLMNAVSQKPFLIKPNHHELSAVAEKTLGDNRQEVLEHAEKLKNKGAENVLVSLAGNGAVLSAANGNNYESAAPSGIVVDSVGAGDSMVAGFLFGWIESGDYEHAFKMSIASGSASTFSKGFAKKSDVLKLYSSLK